MSDCPSKFQGYTCQYAANHGGKHRWRGVEWEQGDQPEKNPWAHITGGAQETLDRIGRMVAEQERVDPVTFACNSCKDIGYIPGRDVHRGRHTYDTVQPCPECPTGWEIAKRRDCPQCGTGRAQDLCTSCRDKQRGRGYTDVTGKKHPPRRDDEPPF